MLKSLFLMLVSLSFFLAIPLDAQCLWRGAKTLSGGSLILMGRGQYSEFTKTYDWDAGDWVTVAEQNRPSQSKLVTMIGFGVTDRIEAAVHLPMLSKDSGGASQTGLGDILIKSRIGLRAWKEDQHGLTLVAAGRLGTGDAGRSPALGDGTTDVGFGGIFSSAWVNDWAGHLKGFYWRNGKNDGEQRIGDQVKMIAKIDRRFSSKWTGFLTYIYQNQADKTDADGNTMAHTSQIRHSVCVGCIFKPLRNLNIRPKITFPIAAQGGNIYNIQPCLDIWTCIPIL